LARHSGRQVKLQKLKLTLGYKGFFSSKRTGLQIWHLKKNTNICTNERDFYWHFQYFKFIFMAFFFGAAAAAID
jgi:hypothetical protein